VGRDEWITAGMTRVSVTAGVLFHSSLPSPPHPFPTTHHPSRGVSERPGSARRDGSEW